MSRFASSTVKPRFEQPLPKVTSRQGLWMLSDQAVAPAIGRIGLLPTRNRRAPSIPAPGKGLDNKAGQALGLSPSEQDQAAEAEHRHAGWFGDQREDGIDPGAAQQLVADDHVLIDEL